MKTNSLRIESRDPVEVAFKHFRSDWRFMREHGWTREAYIKRYGTTENPKMGDGGPLIWRADLFNHARLRQDFVQRFTDLSYHKFVSHRLFHVFAFLTSHREQKRFGDLMEWAKMEPTPKGKNLRSFLPSYT